MSLPTNFLAQGLEVERPYGVIVGVEPSSDASFAVELQRVVGSSSGTFATLATLNPSAQATVGSMLAYTDETPNDQVTRCYRARSVRAGYTASAFTPVVKARPVALLGNDQVGRNVPKIYPVPYTAFTVNQSTTLNPNRLLFRTGFIAPAQTGSVGADRRVAFASLNIPPRVVLTGLTVSRYYSSANTLAVSFNEVALVRQTSTGSPVIADINSTAFYGNQTLSTSFSYQTSTSETYFLAITLGSDVTATGSAIRHVAVRYRTPLGWGQSL